MAEDCHDSNNDTKPDPYEKIDELRDKLTTPSINEQELWKYCDPDGYYLKAR